MLAGAICEGNECTVWVALILAMLAGAVLLAAVVAVAWGFAVAAVLARRGWSKPARVVGGAIGAIVAVAGLYEGATSRTELGTNLAWLIALAAVPVAVWQRRVTRAAQSSPCSTA